MVRHIFPNIVPTLIVLFSLSIPEAIMWESSLSFLGVGVQPPEARRAQPGERERVWPNGLASRRGSRLRVR